MSSAQRAAERAIEAMLDTLMPVEREKHIGGVLQAIDEAGRPNRDYFRSILPPETLRWTPGEMGGYQATARAGKTALAIARVGTAPSGGPAVVTLKWESATQGLTTIGTITVPAGQRFGQARSPEIDALLPAGAWVTAQYTTANGSADMSVLLVLERP